MRPGLDQRFFQSLGQAAVKCIQDVLVLLRGELTLRDNVRFETVAVTFPGVADTEATIDISTLKLPQTPRWIVTLDSSNGGIAYQSSLGSWTASSIKAKCTKASTVAVIGVI